MGLQTDDTIILASDEFASIEDDAAKEAEILTKERTCLTTDSPIKLNGAKVQLYENESITMHGEPHVNGISLIKQHNASATSSRGGN